MKSFRTHCNTFNAVKKGCKRRVTYSHGKGNGSRVLVFADMAYNFKNYSYIKPEKSSGARRYFYFEKPRPKPQL